ncbi:tRNA (adenosine(37)-N6)-threonylcarbamoyltransferase complex ATPase subunit type 1 TsaE [Patescibacteria group bacterium]|nr:tRNA (adenosine(37)-N6)-threonylcarbamoyltransferase complex ATPase subunit type 1 TsaE [Patescibacteria group bacterium]
MEKRLIKNIEEMKDFADSYIKSLKKSENKATVIILRGDLGSGKTTFTQEVANIFEIKDYVTSPTFVIQKRYEINNSQELGFKNLIHIDAYRLSSGKELLDLGWKEDINNPQNIIFIEWPERVTEVLPKNTKEISFKFIDEETREIVYENNF